MKRRVTIKKSVIPGVFTVFNLFFGFLAILMSAQGQFAKACWLILAAAFFDGLDGKVARLFRSPSRFGTEFDSIADLVSFCTAPSALIYFAFLSELHPVPAAVISIVPLVFGGIRLARFNIMASEAELPFFVGLPTTVSAVTTSSFVLFNLTLYDKPGNPGVALTIVFFLALLMVSHVRYAKIPDFVKRIENKLFIPFTLLCIAGIAIWGIAAAFPLAMSYVLWGIIKWVLHHDVYEVELGVESVTKKSNGGKNLD